MTTDRISPSERQLNLTFALLRNPAGLTTRQILATVPGYGYVHEVTDALLRQFERDKSVLKGSGIVLEESELSMSDSDNRVFMYRIATRSFEWPKGFKLNSRQTRLLELAASAWREVELSEELQLALTRLTALGDTPDRSLVNELLPRFRPPEAAFGPLAAAIEAQRSVVFDYRKPGGKVEERTLSPWRVFNVEGQWLVQGWDHNRAAVRNFLLSRILGNSVKTDKSTDGNYRPSAAAELAAADAELATHRANNVAVLEVQPNSPAWSHFEMDFEESGRKQLSYLDEELLAARVRRFGSQVTVISPASLAAAVTAGFERVVSAHA